MYILGSLHMCDLSMGHPERMGKADCCHVLVMLVYCFFKV